MISSRSVGRCIFAWPHDSMTIFWPTAAPSRSSFPCRSSSGLGCARWPRCRRLRSSSASADHAVVLDVDVRARFGLVGAEALQRANLVVTYAALNPRHGHGRVRGASWAATGLRLLVDLAPLLGLLELALRLHIILALRLHIIEVGVQGRLRTEEASWWTSANFSPGVNSIVGTPS